MQACRDLDDRAFRLLDRTPVPVDPPVYGPVRNVRGGLFVPLHLVYDTATGRMEPDNAAKDVLCARYSIFRFSFS